MAVAMPAAPNHVTSTPVVNGRRVQLGVVATAATILGVVAAGMALGYREVDLWGAFAVPALLAAITLPLLRRVERRHAIDLTGVLALALALKFCGAYARYLMVFELYEGGDAMRYLDVGGQTASDFWQNLAGWSALLPSQQGTAFVEELSGLVQALTGRSAMAAFMVFAWLSFLGMWCFVAAARRAVPGLEVRRYAVFVLFLPSMLFWPSSVGKDAWMVLTLGVFALGAARIFTHARLGFVLLMLGALGMAMVRPHLALLAGAAFAVAFVIRSRGRREAALASPFRKLLGVAVLVVAFSFALSQASQLLPGFEDGSLNLDATLNETSRRSEQGGSEIEVTSPNSPLQYPQAFFTVMFRPMLFEARSATAAIAALEGTALLVIAITSRHRITAGIREAARQPYALMAGLYVLGFAFAWSALGNLGIITRQRVQVLPFLVLFLCFQATHRPAEPALGEETSPVAAG